MGLTFEQMCRDYLIYYAKNLPIELNETGQWWGNDPLQKKQIQIDIVGTPVNGKEYLIGSCKYRNDKNYKVVNSKKEEQFVMDFLNKKNAETDQSEVIIDFAGHKLTGHLDMGCSSPLVFTDTVGGGGITDTEKGYIGIYTSDRIIINAGNYSANMNTYFTANGKKIFIQGYQYEAHWLRRRYNKWRNI